MASNVPVVKQVGWLSLVPQLSVMGLLIAVCYLVSGAENAILYGALIYLGISFTFRNVVAKDHREGMRLVKHYNYVEAIPCFDKSYKYFTKNTWVDTYRYLTLLSSSKMCYRGMALCNIAFCYSQIGEGKKAAEFYRQTLETYPENGLAQSGLRMLESAQK